MVPQISKWVSIRWVGQEIELKQAWLYFEVREIEPGQIWQLRNQIFHELNEDQINQINARIGKHYKRASLTLNQPAMAIKIRRWLTTSTTDRAPPQERI